MADQLLTQAQVLLEGQIDFEGQKKTEIMTSIILALTGLLALIIGYVQQDIHLTLWFGLAGTAICFFVVVPPWPAYNENPLGWLPAGSEMMGRGIEVDGKKIN